MDFGNLLGTHRSMRADVTIAALPVTQDHVSGFGILQVDERGRVIGFVEKPQTDAQIEQLRTSPEWLERQGIHSRGRPFLASMGIYVFNRQVLFDMLNAPPLATDFGKEIFPRSIRTHRVQAHLFDGYWEDLGTIKAYHQANIALAGDDPPFQFHTPNGVIYTRMRNLPAAHIAGAALNQSIISDGSYIQSGSSIERSVVGVRSRIGRNVTIRDSVLIGADRYETDAEREANRIRGVPDLTIGEGSVIEHAILDKDCRVGRKVRIVNHQGARDEEGANYVIREGIVVVPRGAMIPDGTVI
jgi:glucose-1-phosphate adenylyltransferase